MSGQASLQNPLLELANALRSKGGIEVHSAVVENGPNGPQRVEYIRGADLVKHVEERPQLYARFATKGKPAAEQGREVGELLLRRAMLRRCDHFHKKPPPGKKLAKYPRKLLFFYGAEAMTFGEDSFYAWTYDRPTSPWVYVGAALAVVGALLASLFPLAPYSVKVAVLYASAGLLTLLVALMVVRALVAAVSWVASGKTVWILPNVLQEVPLSQLFKPLVSVEPSDPASWGAHPLVRVGVGAGLAVLLYVLYAHAPDKGSVAREASKYRDEIFDLLNMHQEGRGKIAGNVTEPPPGNVTTDGGSSGGSSSGAGEGPEVEPGVEFELFGDEL